MKLIPKSGLHTNTSLLKPTLRAYPRCHKLTFSSTFWPIDKLINSFLSIMQSLTLHEIISPCRPPPSKLIICFFVVFTHCLNPAVFRLHSFAFFSLFLSHVVSPRPTNTAAPSPSSSPCGASLPHQVFLRRVLPFYHFPSGPRRLTFPLRCFPFLESYYYYLLSQP